MGRSRSLPLGVLFAALAAAALSAAAAPMADMRYTVRVPVADAGPAARDAALREALAALLARRTGDRTVAERKAVREALARAGAYVLAYRYVRGPAPAAGPSGEAGGPAPDEAGGARQLLEVRFDPAGVEALLARLGLAVWPEPPPALLAWVVVDDGRGRRLVTDASPQELTDTLRAVAARRGVVLVLPLADVEDLSRVDMADLWGGFWERIEAASARYGPTAVLLGRVRLGRRAEWEGRWTVRVAGGAVDWTVRTGVLAPQLEAGIHGAVDVMAARLARPAAAPAQGSLLLVVEGVGGVEDYARTLQALEGMDGVTGVRVLEAEADRLRLELHGRGGPSALRAAVARLPLLEPAAGGGTSPDPLHVRLRPSAAGAAPADTGEGRLEDRIP